ncbi:MAG: LCP family protein [Lachnospiraceae bacterium]|nr:LCP family protein [Lachnospiraceae bacterium]
MDTSVNSAENKRSPRRKKGKKLLLILLSLVVLAVGGFAAAAAGLYFSGESSLKKTEAVPSFPIAEPIPGFEGAGGNAKMGLSTLAWQDDWAAYNGEVYEYKKDCINLLFLGVDKNGKLKQETDFSNWNAGQTDAVFLVSIDPDAKRACVIAVPRNSMVELEIYGKDGEVSATNEDALCLQFPYAGGGPFGMEKASQRVSEIFYNIPIHGVSAISLDSIAILIDAVGGVDVVLTDDIHEIEKGHSVGETYTLTKKNATAYLRKRDTNIDATPTVRLTRQKEALKAIAAKLMENPTALPGLCTKVYKEILPYMLTDITLDEAVYLAKLLSGCHLDGKDFYQLAGENVVKPNNIGVNFDAFYLNEDALKETAIAVFYRKLSR